MPDDVLAEGDIFNRAPRTRPVLIPHCQLDSPAVLGREPIVLKDIALYQQSTRVLELKIVFDRSPHPLQLVGLKKWLFRISMSEGTKLLMEGFPPPNIMFSPVT